MYSPCSVLSSTTSCRQFVSPACCFLRSARRVTGLCGGTYFGISIGLGAHEGCSTGPPLCWAKPGDEARAAAHTMMAVSYTHLRAHETPEHLVCRLLLE